MFDYFSYLDDIKICYLAFVTSFIFDILRRLTTLYERHSVFFVVAHVTSLLKFRILPSLLTSRVSLITDFSSTAKIIDQTLSQM